MAIFRLRTILIILLSMSFFHRVFLSIKNVQHRTNWIFRVEVIETRFYDTIVFIITNYNRFRITNNIVFSKLIFQVTILLCKFLKLIVSVTTLMYQSVHSTCFQVDETEIETTFERQTNLISDSKLCFTRFHNSIHIIIYIFQTSFPCFVCLYFLFQIS